MVIMWSAPATLNMLATNLADIGARLFSFNATINQANINHESNNESGYFVLFVLSGVRKDRNDGSDSSSRGYLASVDHNEQFHDVVVYLTTTTLNDEHVFAAH